MGGSLGNLVPAPPLPEVGVSDTPRSPLCLTAHWSFKPESLGPGQDHGARPVRVPSGGLAGEQHRPLPRPAVLSRRLALHPSFSPHSEGRPQPAVVSADGTYRRSAPLRWLRSSASPPRLGQGHKLPHIAVQTCVLLRAKDESHQEPHCRSRWWSNSQPLPESQNLLENRKGKKRL